MPNFQWARAIFVKEKEMSEQDENGLVLVFAALLLGLVVAIVQIIRSFRK